MRAGDRRTNGSASGCRNRNARTDRNARAAELLENGYKRYFWKSLFGTSLDGLAVQASANEEPAHLRAVICGPRPKKRRHRARKSGITPKAAEFPRTVRSAAIN